MNNCSVVPSEIIESLDINQVPHSLVAVGVSESNLRHGRIEYPSWSDFRRISRFNRLSYLIIQINLEYYSAIVKVFADGNVTYLRDEENHAANLFRSLFETENYVG